MARGSTRSEEVNEITKQIIAETVGEEYQAYGITNNPNSIYADDDVSLGTRLTRKKKELPTIGSWYRRLLRKSQENDNIDYQFHFSYLIKVMRQYTRVFDVQIVSFYGRINYSIASKYLFTFSLRLLGIAYNVNALISYRGGSVACAYYNAVTGKLGESAVL